MEGLTPFVCPDCGLVIEASAAQGPQWMREHRFRFHPVRELASMAQNMATQHKWRHALTVADAAWLHSLEIDPT